MVKHFSKLRFVLMNLAAFMVFSLASCGEKTTGEQLIDAVNNGTEQQIAEIAPKAYAERQQLSVRELVFLSAAYMNMTGGDETPENMSLIKRAAECYNMAMSHGEAAVEKVWEEETSGLSTTEASQVLIVRTALRRIARDYK